MPAARGIGAPGVPGPPPAAPPPSSAPRIYAQLGGQTLSSFVYINCVNIPWAGKKLKGERVDGGKEVGGEMAKKTQKERGRGR